jgi:hypothetical protein
MYIFEYLNHQLIINSLLAKFDSINKSINQIIFEIKTF